jgi:hypothetical protein
MTQLDLRRDTRYEVQLSCRISSPLRSFSEIAGVTLNMSRSGLLAVFGEAGSPDVSPLVGAPVRIRVELPGPSGKSARCVECLGRVARVGEQSAPRQVAFALQRYQFQPGVTPDSPELARDVPFDDLQ